MAKKTVEITVTETATYSFTVEIDEDEEMDEAQAEHHWLQQEPAKCLVSVDERELEWTP